MGFIKRAKTNKIVLHHSLTKDGKVVDWNAIKKYHIEVNKWEDIGYHFGIEKINDEYQILVGRGLHLVGAHTEGWNAMSIGICFVGNYDIEQPEESMLILAVEKLIIPLMYIFDISINSIYGHRDFNPQKTCPGKLFSIDRVKLLIKEKKKLLFEKADKLI